MAWQKRGENADGGKFPGGTWHIFPHVLEKTYDGRDIVERTSWRGVVALKRDGKMYWKASQDKRIVELWVRDKIKECRELPKPKERKVRMNAKIYLEMLRNKEK